MAITMMLCSTGVLHIEQGVMLVLGENVGTTITSNIVALSANTQARRAAFAHLSFNEQAAYLLAEYATPQLRHVWLCHLSEENNHPVLARKTVEAVLRQHGIIPGVDFELDILGDIACLRINYILRRLNDHHRVGNILESLMG